MGSELLAAAFPLVISVGWFVGFILFMDSTCKRKSDDTQDTNAPFDDVTHWVGNLPSKDTDSTKRVTQRSTWRKIKSNILSKKLGVETKRED